MSDKTIPENQAVIEAIERLTKGELVTPDGAEHPLLLIPKGKELKDLTEITDKYLKNPRRRKGSARFTTMLSFSEHTNRFKDENTVIFADDSGRSDPSLTAVLNYNEKGNGQARFGDHRSIYMCPLSDEWKFWSAGADGMTQADFAQMLEDHIGDVLEMESVGASIQLFASKLFLNMAGPQRLIELSRGLSLNVESQVGSKVNLSSGEVQITFQDEHKDPSGAPIKVPGGFAIGIPIFKTGEMYQIPVRLKYRVKGPTILWGFSLYRPDVYKRDAFKDAAKIAETLTACPVYFGTPES